MKPTTAGGRKLAMRSMPSHEYTDTLDTRSKPDTRARHRKSSLAYRLDEFAIHTSTAVALLCLAAAASGVTW